MLCESHKHTRTHPATPKHTQSRSLEDAGLSRQQADALTDLVTRTLCVAREKMVVGFVDKADLEKAAMEQDSRVAAFRSEVSKSQELHIASLSRDTERLTASLDKVRSEIRSVEREEKAGVVMEVLRCVIFF